MIVNIMIVLHMYALLYTYYNFEYLESPDCPLSIKNPVTISNDLSCHISDYCTAADICLYIPLINRNIHAYLRLHSCDALLEVGIEQFTFSVGLFDYEFGKYDVSFTTLHCLTSLTFCIVKETFLFEY
jgi:hypothetical protein